MGERHFGRFAALGCVGGLFSGLCVDYWDGFA